MTENPGSNSSKTLHFKRFPKYHKYSKKYSKKNIRKEFEERNHKKIEDYIRENSTSDEDFKRKLQLYYSLYAFQDREIDEPALKALGTNTTTKIDFAENGELSLLVKFEKADLGRYGLAIRDGKITLSTADLSPAQIKEMYHFLYMRGLASSLVLPPDLDESLRNGFKEEIENYVPQEREHDLDKYDEKLDNEEAEFPKEATRAQLINTSKQEKKKYGVKDAIHEINEWAWEQGERNGLNFFHKRARGGWHVFTAYKNLNPDNAFDKVKVDKDGNIVPNFKYKIWVREKKGVMEFGYSVPPGEEFKKDQAEMIVKMVAKTGRNAIIFYGVTEHFYYTIRKACSKELVVPIGISLKPDGTLAMIKDARGYHPQGPAVARYERLLVEQIKTNAINAGRDMNPSELKLYQDVFVRANLVNFRPLYAGALKSKLDNLAKDGVAAKTMIAASNIVIDFYEAYKSGVELGLGQDGKVPTIENVLKFKVRENIGGKITERPLMTEEQIARFKKLNPGVDISTKIMPDMSAKEIEDVYTILLSSYEVRAKQMLDEAYIRGGPTDSAERTTANLLKNIEGKLKGDVASDFRANVDLDGIPPLPNHSIILPSIGSISNPYYEVEKDIKEKRVQSLKDRGMWRGGGSFSGGDGQDNNDDFSNDDEKKYKKKTPDKKEKDKKKTEDKDDRDSKKTENLRSKLEEKRLIEAERRAFEAERRALEAERKAFQMEKEFAAKKEAEAAKSAEAKREAEEKAKREAEEKAKKEKSKGKDGNDGEANSQDNGQGHNPPINPNLLPGGRDSR